MRRATPEELANGKRLGRGMGVLSVGVMTVTNLVLIGRGVPFGDRVVPMLVASAAAVTLFIGWQLWRDARAKT